MQAPISRTLSSVVLGDPTFFESLTMFPLVGPADAEREPGYLTLDQSLAGGWTEITEISEQGSVPELRVINKGERPVFILDGEELVGAKQNRVVNLSILVPAASTLTIPVSCVEAGRWRARSRAFSSAPRTQYAAGRAKRVAQVTESILLSGERRSDQAEVWADIAETAARLEAPSPTGAMEEIFVRHHERLEACVHSIHPVARQVGALFVLRGRVVGFDLFDAGATLRRLLPKLLRSVAVDALDHPGTAEPRVSPALERKVAEHFLSKVSAADVHEADATGLGRDLRLVAPSMSGAGLVADGAVVHLSAFQL